MSSLRRGHANLLCIVPILTDDPQREFALGLADLAVAEDAYVYIYIYIYIYLYKYRERDVQN